MMLAGFGLALLISVFTPFTPKAHATTGSSDGFTYYKYQWGDASAIYKQVVSSHRYDWTYYVTAAQWQSSGASVHLNYVPWIPGSIIQRNLTFTNDLYIRVENVFANPQLPDSATKWHYLTLDEYTQARQFERDYLGINKSVRSSGVGYVKQAGTTPVYRVYACGQGHNKEYVSSYEYQQAGYPHVKEYNAVVPDSFCLPS